MSSLLLRFVLLGALLIGASGAPKDSQQKLMKSLFSSKYSYLIAPQKDLDSPVMVKFSNMSLDFEFNEEKSELVIMTPIVISWTDPRMAWDVSKNGGIKVLTFNSKQKCWTPEIYFYSMHTSEYQCKKMRVYHTGRVQCLTDIKMYQWCYPMKTSLYPVDSFTCFVGINWWARINITCDVPWRKCWNISQLSPHAVWHINATRYRTRKVTYKQGGDYCYMSAAFTLTRRNSTKVVFALPIIIVGLLVILQNLLVMNFRERSFLLVLLMTSALLILDSLEMIPGIRVGKGPKLLRMTGAVLMITGVLLAFNSLILAATARLKDVWDSKLESMVALLDRLHLSFILPSSVKAQEGESLQLARFGVIVDRLAFVVMALILIIIMAVP